MTEVQTWLLNWFAARAPLPNLTPEAVLELNYFQAKMIDSMAVIELIADLEEHFNICFEQEHFQERRFSTVVGLASLVDELRPA